MRPWYPRSQAGISGLQGDSPKRRTIYVFSSHIASSFRSRYIRRYTRSSGAVHGRGWRAALDRPTGNISQWVADLRASFRDVAGGVVILAAVSTLVIEVTPDVGDLVWQSANSVWAFLFGDRMYTYIKRGK